MKKKHKPKKQPRAKRMVIDIAKMDQLVDKATKETLSQTEGEHLKEQIHAMARRLVGHRTSEKAEKLDESSEGEATSEQADEQAEAVVGQESGPVAADEQPPQEGKPPRPGHGRNGRKDYPGADTVVVPPTVAPKTPCENCKGKLYPIPPKVLLRIKGLPPVQATVYELGQLRCNLCGEILTAPAPPSVGEEKYDASVTAMVALFKYGSGLPFNRIEGLQQQFGVPLPAGTQWDLLKAQAEAIWPLRDEFIRRAAQGSVVTYDDTRAQILDEIERPEGQAKDRTGIKTTGFVSEVDGHKLAYYITGPNHAGENLKELLKHREAGLPALIAMADALACNVPKDVPPGVELLIANCLTHGRRQFVDIYESFPEECRHVVDQIGLVYLHDDEARLEKLTPEARLELHKRKSAPILDELKRWMESLVADKKAEPNSGLGIAVKYFLKRWDELTVFLREPGAPLDSNIVERALKKAILNRKNAYFFKTQRGARIGDFFMSLIHTCELNGQGAFEYLLALFRHAAEVATNPGAWMPWSFRGQLRPAPD